MKALHKIREAVATLAAEAIEEGRENDAHRLNVIARQLDEQAHMISEGLHNGS